MDFKGKKYIVTGASSGIGRSISIELANRGGAVVLVGRNKDALEDTRSEMHGDEHVIFQTDLAQDEIPFEQLMNVACSDGRKIDGLVHCAGVSSVLPIASITRKRMEECMCVNTYAFIELVKHAVKRKYRSEKMSIVAISSIAAKQPEKCQTVYAMSKAALNAAVQSLAIELASKNIRINSICPGVTGTRLAKAMLDQGADPGMDKQLLGMLAPEQIATCAMFLLDDMSSAMTGRVLYADGGRLL